MVETRWTLRGRSHRPHLADLSAVRVLVVGGNGAVAGAAFLSRLTSAVAGRFELTDDDAFPLIEFTTVRACVDARGEVRGGMGRLLAEVRARDFHVGAVLCNTLSTVADLASEEPRLVDMARVARDRLEGASRRLLCSRRSRDARLFGVRHRYSGDAEQDHVDAVIADVIRGRRPDLSALDPSRTAVLCCTELSCLGDGGRDDTCEFLIEEMLEGISRCASEQRPE